MQRHFDFVLLGGGPVSVSAAETLRAEGAKGSILLVSEEDCVPYGHSYLSKRFLLGAQPKERLLIHSEAYYRDHAIELMLSTLTVAVDTTNRLVRTDRAGDILISGEAHGPWLVEDCALAAENLMLAACAAGLGTCWIGFTQSFLNTPEGKKVLDLPAGWVPVASVIRRTYHRRSPGRSRKYAGSANRYLLSSYGRELVAVQ